MEPVEDFFSRVHQDWLQRGRLDTCGMWACYGALIDALGVEAARAPHKEIAEGVIAGTAVGPSQQNLGLFEWLGGYQLLHPNWRNDALKRLPDGSRTSTRCASENCLVSFNAFRAASC